MLFEIVSTSAAVSLLGLSYLKRSELDDGEKIKKIAFNCGLYVKEGKEVKSMQLLRKARHEWGTEYIYRIPLGLSFSDIQKKADNLRDGLNNRKGRVDLMALTKIDFRSNVISQIREILQNRFVSEKDIEMSYDGTLHIIVLDREMPANIAFGKTMLGKCIDWEIPLGETRYGFIHHDMEKGHITLAGATRKGKTVFLKLMITALINNQPENTKLTLIDLKGGLAFTRFKNAKQVET
ncbi:FtsK/SpoIIIE domain-containing protein, partial [Cytobacillus firmus]